MEIIKPILGHGYNKMACQKHLQDTTKTEGDIWKSSISAQFYINVMYQALLSSTCMLKKTKIKHTENCLYSITPV